MRKILLCLALVLPFSAWGDSALSDDVSDLWWNPAESGWGLNLVQQADIAFATLFVYGPDGKPKWYVASEMDNQGLGSSGRDPSFSGTLYETTGPTSPNAFDPTKVTARAVGTITFVQATPASAVVMYSIDGATVTKQVVRQTWRISNIGGAFAGTRVTRGFNCPPDNAVTENLGMIIVDQPPGSSSITITANGTTPSTSCLYSGSYSQGGRMGLIDGTFSCGDGASGPFRMEEVEVNPDGFSSHYSAIFGGCQVRGHFGGVRATVHIPPD